VGEEEDRDDERQQRQRDDDEEQLRVVGPEGDLEGRQVWDLRQRRQQPLGDRVEQDEDADRGVENGLDQEGGGHRRVGGAGDLPLDQEYFGRVAGVGGNDGVDPGPRQVGRRQRQVGDPLLRVGRPQHVAPGPGAGELHPQQAAEGEREGGPVDFREVAEEFGAAFEEGFEVVLEIGERHHS
jgi:hypothetical protein